MILGNYSKLATSIKHFIFIITLIAIGIISGLYIFPLQKNPLTNSVSESNNLVKKQIDGIQVLSDMDLKPLKDNINFLKLVIKEEFIPIEITIKSKNNLNGNNFEGNWTIKGRNLYLLSSIHDNSSYIRIWTTYFGDKIDPEESNRLILKVFRDNFAANFISKINCRKTINNNLQREITLCSSMKQDQYGNMTGITVGAPYSVRNRADIIIVSACFIPKVDAPDFEKTFCQ